MQPAREPEARRAWVHRRARIASDCPLTLFWVTGRLQRKGRSPALLPVTSDAVVAWSR